MSRKIIGITVGTQLPKPNFKQTDPTKGDYIRNKPDFDGLKSRVKDVEDALIAVDSTLSIEGHAADAKAVGYAIGNLNSLVGDQSVSAQIASATSSLVKTVNGAAPDEYGNLILVTDHTLTKSGVAADSKTVGDLWRLVADDSDVVWLLEQLGIVVNLASNTLDNATLGNLVLG